MSDRGSKAFSAGQRRLIRLSDAQADLSRRRAHMQSERKCCAPAQFKRIMGNTNFSEQV